MSERFRSVIAAIDAANDADPTRVTEDGVSRGAAVIYGERMTECLERLAPEANELLQIAIRAQHLERFKLPRSNIRWTNPAISAGATSSAAAMRHV